MKKRLFLTVFAVIAAIICTLGFAACATNGNGTGSGGGSISGGNNDNNDNDNNGGGNTDDNDDNDGEETPAPHTHSSDKWLFDKNSHWKLCNGCGEEFEKAYHDENGDCEVCGYAYATEGLAYELNAEKTAYTVTGIGEATDSKIAIPAEYNGLPVTGIAVRAFNKSLTITAVTVPDSVTTIGSQAFYECANLKSVVLPVQLTKIESNLFFDCAMLDTVTIPVSVTEISAKALAGCVRLKTVNYGGTTAQWNSITKGDSWKHNSNSFTVKCSNGDIAAEEA